MSNRNFEQFVQGANGTYTINDAVAHVVNCIGIQVDADTVFSHIKIDGIDSDVKNTYVANSVGTVMKTLITPEDGHYFSSVQLVSGQVTLIKRVP